MSTTPPRWARASTALWRRTLDAVLVVVRTDDLTSLEGAARVIWELLDRPSTVDELVEELAALHAMPVAGIRADVETAIAMMSRLGVIEAGGSAPDPNVVASRRVLRTVSLPDDPMAALASWGIGATSTLPDLATIGWDVAADGWTRERLTGLVYGAVAAGDLVVDDPVHRADVASRHRRSMVTALRLERLLVETVDALAASSIDAVVLKGPSIAHTAYDDPAFRPFGDIDLMVRAKAIDATFAVLSDLGHQRRFSQPRPGFDRRFGKGAAFVTGDGLEIDVHRTFASGPFGLTVDLDDAHRNTGRIRVGGRSIATLAPAQQLVAVSVHAAVGTRWPRLLNLRDVVQLLVSDAVDLDAAVETAARWRVDAALARAVREAAAAFQLGDDLPLAAWARGHVPGRGQRRAMAAYISPRRGYSRQAVAALAVIPGVRLRASYLRAMLLPDPTYEAGRGEGRWRRLRRIVRTTVLERR